MKICPKCGAVAEFNAYYGRITCTRCNWEDKESPEQLGLVWLLIDVKDLENTLPSEGQPIYLSIAEGEGKPFTDPVRAKADQAMLRDLLKLHPHWLILWQPQPSPPPAPMYRSIIEFTKSISRQKAPTSQAEGSEKGGIHGE